MALGCDLKTAGGIVTLALWLLAGSLLAGVRVGGAQQEGPLISRSETASTSFLAAARRGDLGTVQRALGAGIRVDLTDEYGATALFRASAAGHTMVIKALLSAGAKVNSLNNQRFTPLMAAAFGGHADAVDVLLASGADPTLRNADGATALALATIMGRDLIVKRLTNSRLLASVCDETGKLAPLGFMLKDINGRNVEMSQYLGKVILLEFWATWAGGSNPWLIEFQGKYGRDGFAVLSVSDDRVEVAREFALRNGLNYPVLFGLGPSGDFADVWGEMIFGFPTRFLIRRDGRICKTEKGAPVKEQLERAITVLLSQ